MSSALVRGFMTTSKLCGRRERRTDIGESAFVDFFLDRPVPRIGIAFLGVP